MILERYMSVQLLSTNISFGRPRPMRTRTVQFLVSVRGVRRDGDLYLFFDCTMSTHTAYCIPMMSLIKSPSRDYKMASMYTKIHPPYSHARSSVPPLVVLIKLRSLLVVHVRNYCFRSTPASPPPATESR